MPTNLISRIEGLLEKATPKPWLLYPRPTGYLGDLRRSGEQLITYELVTDKPNWVAHFLLREDAQLTEELRNAAPALMKVLKAAQELMAQDATDDTAEYEALRASLAELEERDATK